jgi:hypothetical protein
MMASSWGRGTLGPFGEVFRSVAGGPGRKLFERCDTRAAGWGTFSTGV